MKTKQWLQQIALKLGMSLGVLLFFLASIQVCSAQAGYLINEINNTPIDSTATKIIVLIHGWNPDDLPNMYAADPWSSLIYDTKQKLNNSDWKLFTFHWENKSMGANTGPIYDWHTDGFNVEGVGNAVAAAIYGDAQGRRLGSLINQASPNLRRIQLIAHSAGTWVARAAATNILMNNPYVTVQITLLDPFIPDAIPLQSTGQNDASIEQLASAQGNDRIPLLENYFSYDLKTYIATDQTFSWRSGDVNQHVDWNSFVFADYYSTHSGPIEFYGDTVYQTIVGNPTPGGLYGLGCPFDFSQVGWLRSLFYTDQVRSPGIAIQPQSQSAVNGSSVTLSVTASSSHPLSYQWFHDGQSVGGATGASYSFTMSPSGTGAYVVKISYQDAVGYTFSDPATVSITTPAAATTTSVSPTSLPTSGSTQLINIYGTNFKPAGDPNASTLIFRDPANNVYVRTPVYVSTNQLQYNINVQSAINTWSVIVTNAGLAASNPQYFTVYTAPANTGSLVVNLSPPGIGAQWQLNGIYHNSGDVVASLTPGQYSVLFKAVSGYTTPTSFLVNIVANAETTTNATYSAVAATTYTLTLNAASGQGSITPSPIGSGGSNTFTYNSGSLVQLTATAATGYHFTGWSGDASGSVNPTTITMNGNKTVSASFASGDPNIANVTVTIKPDGAANAGVTWSVTGDSQLRASGTSLSEPVGSGYTTLLPVTLNLVAGWLGTNGITSIYVPITAGIVTNVTLTCVPDTTPGLLTVTLSPPDAVTAGAHWHVNGGAAQGNGSTLSLSPGTNYSITFDSVSGWTAPTNRTVTVTRAQNTTVIGNYAPPVGQPLIYSVSPPIGALAGGTLMTINGVNFTAPATVLIGGQSAQNVSISSATQITCSTPSSSTNGTVSIVVQTVGGSATNHNGYAYGISLGKKLSLLGSTGGSMFGTAVQGNYAYIGEGRNLLVLDVSSPSSPSRIGKVTLPGVVAGVALFGQYAYVADGEGGVQVVDITTPSLPVIRGFYSPTNYTWSAGIKIYGGRAYVADEINGLEILDLGNPTTPTLLSCTHFGGWADDDVIIKASVQGVFAYITTEDKLQVVDVSQPTSPLLLGQVTFTGGGGVATIAMSGNYVFGGSIYDGGTMHVVDVSNPNAPIDSTPSLGGYGTGGYCSMAAANNYLYVQSSWSGFGFSVFSLSGPTLTQVGRYSPYGINGYYTRMIISGNRAYVGGGQTGFAIFDISSPYSPSLLSTFTDSGLVGGYQCAAVTGNALCAPDGANFKVFNVSQPGQPALVANISGTGTGAGGQVLAHNGVAFLKGNGTQIYDVTTPSSPHLLSTISSGVANNYRMALADNRLYIVGYNGLKPTFVAVDVSAPSIPSVLGTKTISTSPDNTIGYSITARGNRALLGVSGAEQRIVVMDISNISSPIEQGSLTNIYAYDMRISSVGNFAYFVDNNAPSVLHVLDLNNPSYPVITNSIAIDVSQAMSMEILDNELYVTTLKGVYVFDTSRPQTPTLSRSYAMSFIRNNSIGVTSDSVNQSGIIYIADGEGGVVVLNEQDILSPSIYITTPVFAPIYTNNSSSIALGGGSDDNVGVTAIAWANDRGGSGQVSPPLDNWYVSGIKLYPGSNNITATAYDAAGNSGADVLTVIYPTANQNQSIIFPAIAAHMFGDCPITLSAAAGSGLPVTFSVVSGPATLTSSNVLTLTGAGTVTVQASQPGNSFYNAALSTNVSFSVTRANQVIAFAPIPAKSAGDAPFALSATASSSLPVYFSILSGPAILDASNNVTLVGGGTVSILAWQPGNSNYNAAATVQQNISVSLIPQSIAFGALSQQRSVDAPFPIFASASSGLPVSFSVLSGPAQLNGNVMTLTGAGTVTVRASQLGNNVYAAAAYVDQSLTVLPPSNTVGSPQYNVSGFNLTFYGTVGSNYVFQASSNLLSWTTLQSFSCTNIIMNFRDTSATGMARRFYQIKPQ